MRIITILTVTERERIEALKEASLLREELTGR
jgi:hypothetical protein